MIIAVIPAKGESTRLPGKNLLQVNNKTLIEHAVEYARRSERIDRIFVSTDSDKIAGHAGELGVDVIRRGSELAGETPLSEVYRHAWENAAGCATHVVGIQPDNPDRQVDADRAIDFAVDHDVDNLITVGRDGKRNGALQIMSARALKAGSIAHTVTWPDDCTNIHTWFDYHLALHGMSEQAQAIEIEGKRVGSGEPTFIVAEAACNHMCRMDLAKQMVDRAAEAGADSIKFQTYRAEKLVTKDAVSFWGGERISQIDYYRRLDRFGKDEYREIFAYARKRGIVPFSSPFDAQSTEMLADLGVQLFKIASCDINNIEHLRQVAGFGLPIILSTGASTVGEIDRAIETIFKQGNHELMLLACTLSYPTRYADANLERIRTLRDRYPDITVGISDHTEPDDHMVVPAVAVSLGARIVEKHFTLDRTMTGSGHFFATDPGSLKKMVANIRLAERVLGCGDMGVADAERKAWNSARRSIVSDREILPGTTITTDMLGFKRPGDGLPADRLGDVLGKRAACLIGVDEKISMDKLVD